MSAFEMRVSAIVIVWLFAFVVLMIARLQARENAREQRKLERMRDNLKGEEFALIAARERFEADKNCFERKLKGLR